MAKIAEKNHRNGALNPLAQFRREMPAEKICEMAGADAYRQAGIDDPRSSLAMAEVHDCFTPTEMVSFVSILGPELG